jgi:hypothetical protein
MRAAAARNPVTNKSSSRPQGQTRSQQPAQHPIPKVPTGYNAWTEKNKSSLKVSQSATALNSATPVVSSVSETSKLSTPPTVEILVAEMAPTTVSTVPLSNQSSSHLPTLPERSPPLPAKTLVSTETLALTRQEITALLQVMEDVKQRVKDLYSSLGHLAEQTGLSVPSSFTPIQRPSSYSEEERQEIVQQAQDAIREQFEQEESQRQSRPHSQSRHQRQQQKQQSYQPPRASSRLKEQRQKRNSSEQKVNDQSITVLSNSNFIRYDSQQNQLSDTNPPHHGFGRQMESQGSFNQSRTTSKKQEPKYILMEVFPSGSPIKINPVMTAQPTPSPSKLQQQNPTMIATDSTTNSNSNPSTS